MEAFMANLDAFKTNQTEEKDVPKNDTNRLKVLHLLENMI